MLISLVFDFEKLQKLRSKKIKLLHLIGGGINSKLLFQLTSNIAGLPLIAGPAETTSIGNFLMQLKGNGDIDNLKEGREVSGKSSHIIHYNPKNNKNWDDEYGNYLKILQRKK